MKTRTFDEAVEWFVEQVRLMQIEERYKIQLVGMVSALQTIRDMEKDSR